MPQANQSIKRGEYSVLPALHDAMYQELPALSDCMHELSSSQKTPISGWLVHVASTRSTAAT